MKKINGALMYVLVKIGKMRLLSFILAAIIILLSIKIASNNMIVMEDTANTDLNDNSNISAGSISTSVEKDDDLSDNISVYDLGDGFSEIEDIVATGASSSSSSSSSS